MTQVLGEVHRDAETIFRYGHPLRHSVPSDPPQLIQRAEHRHDLQEKLTKGRQGAFNGLYSNGFISQKADKVRLRSVFKPYI